MLGIIGAMDEEVAKIKEQMSDVTITKTAGMEFFEGKLGGKDCVVVRSGIGKVNAGMCTQILADKFGVDAVINTGIAGSLRAEINIGDVVLSTDALQHDMDATGFGYKPGQIPRVDTLSFKADEKLIRLAEECCRRVNPEIGVFRGRVVSGDQFISDLKVKERLAAEFQGCCAEMEGAAIAQTAWRNQIPFVILRVISDKADGSAVADDNTFTGDCVRHCLRLVRGMVKKL